MLEAYRLVFAILVIGGLLGFGIGMGVAFGAWLGFRMLRVGKVYTLTFNNKG